MDTLTQGLLGGTIGALVYRKTSPRKGWLIGATVGVLPDLDIFIPQPDMIATMTEHRSWSHSWLVQTLVSPLIALLLKRVDRTTSFKTIWLLVWLALITHSALDALTVYGTQLFWPFMPHPASGGSIFIIDPLYSVPLIIAALFMLIKPAWQQSHRVLLYSFIFSCAYLVWGLVAQQVISIQVKQQLAKDNIDFVHTQVSATAFNTLLWRVLVITDDHYYEGFRSLLDDGKTIHLQRFDRGTSFIELIRDNPHYQRMKWFTHDRIKLAEIADNIVLSDLRMGQEPFYMFSFSIADAESGQVTKPKRVRPDFDRNKALQQLWRRIWHEPENTDVR